MAAGSCIRHYDLGRLHVGPRRRGSFQHLPADGWTSVSTRDADGAVWLNLFENIGLVQWLHRVLAIITVVVI